MHNLKLQWKPMDVEKNLPNMARKSVTRWFFKRLDKVIFEMELKWKHISVTYDKKSKWKGLKMKFFTNSTSILAKTTTDTQLKQMKQLKTIKVTSIPVQHYIIQYFK